MFIRRKPNKSGTYSVQVINKRGRTNVVLKSFGASKDEEELKRMEQEAYDFMSTYGGQTTLDFSTLPSQ